MDPISVLGLAASIVQLVELATRCIDFHCPTNSSLLDQGNAFSIETDLNDIMDHLQWLRSNSRANDVEEKIIKCYACCDDISKALRIFPEPHSVSEEHPRMVLNGEVRRLIQDELSFLRKEMAVLSLKFIREWCYTDGRSSAHHSLTAYMNYCFGKRSSLSSHQDHTRLLQPSGLRVIDLLTSNIPASSREKSKEMLKNDITAEMYNSLYKIDSVPGMSSSVWLDEMQRTGLRRSQYSELGDRKVQVQDTTIFTSRWIIESHSDPKGLGIDFRDWLSNDQPLFWIHGKPGSGKSTLMKYIVSRPQFSASTRRCSRAAVRPLIDHCQDSTFNKENSTRVNVTSILLDCAGSLLHGSAIELLRLILCQLLAQNFHPILPQLFAELEAEIFFGEDSTPLCLLELQQMLISILQQSHQEFKIFLFIDGLGDFSDHNDTAELLELLRNIMECSRVKICISSRSSTQTYEMHVDTPILTLEACNESDMQAFVFSEIESHWSVGANASDALYTMNKLTEQIVTKAAGSFLWATVMVKLLQKDITDGIDTFDMIRHIQECPLESNDLFRIISDELKTTESAEYSSESNLASGRGHTTQKTETWPDSHERPKRALSTAADDSGQLAKCAKTHKIACTERGSDSLSHFSYDLLDFHSSRCKEETHQNRYSTHSDSDSYSSISTTSSLDDDHPLNAHEAEVIQTVFEGFQKFVKRNTDMELKVFQARQEPLGKRSERDLIEQYPKGYALQDTSNKGHQAVVQVMLDNGANVNAQSGEYSNAPQASSKQGHQEAIQLLLDNGAEVNTHDGHYGNALQAASDGRNQEIINQLLLDEGADINAQSNFWGNALQAASKEGHQEIVQILLNKGADINVQGGYYGNALQAASYRGHQGIVRLLLDKGADRTVADKNGWMPLISASANGHVEVVKMLLDNGADWAVADNKGWTPLNIASDNGHTEVVKMLLEKGADWRIANKDGWTPLNAASSNGHIEVVKMLLDKGAEWSATDKNGWMPLVSASGNGHTEVVKILLGKGADWAVVDNNGWTQLKAASANGYTEVDRMLLDKGADWAVANKNGWTSLRSSSSSGHTEVVKMLLGSGADPTTETIHGLTPLLSASRGGHIDLIRALLGQGASVNAIDMSGQTPLSLAAKQGQILVVKLLLSVQIDGIDRRDTKGLTALTWAAKRGNSDIMDLLFKRRANSTIIDSHGTTYLSLASREGHAEIVRGLLDYGAD